MASFTTIQPDPSVIGGVSKAPFVRLPDPGSLFARRAARFRALAEASELAPYLHFLGAIADCQAAILPGLPSPTPPDSAVIERSREFGMPPLDRGAFKADTALNVTFAKLFEAFATIEKPPAAADALAHVHGLDEAGRDAIVADMLTHASAADQVAEQAYVAAVLQVHFARLAAGLAEDSLVPVDVGICPACGGPPAVSMIAGWMGAEGARYAFCALCATLWNEVRVKCLACGSTKGIGLQEIDGQGGTIKAETCGECGSYVKVLYHNRDTALDPVADDVASVGLDMLLRDSPYRRAGFNPFLVGY